MSRSLQTLTTAAAALALLTWPAAATFAHDGHDHGGRSHSHRDEDGRDRAAGHDHEGHDHDGHNHGGEVLAYRLSDWKEVHFDDADQAEQHFQTVQRLGCEVRESSHADHLDVIYRCPRWKSISLRSHDLAHRWEEWLISAGFDTSHGHVDESFAEGAERVEFRLTEWETLHGDAAQASQIEQVAETLEKLGCQVERDGHGGHDDVRYRCPLWTEIHVSNHRTAEQWLAWLDANGFETRHEH